MVRLRAAVGAVELIDARQGGPVIERLRAKGIDLDQGNVFSYGGRDYVGPEDIQAVAKPVLRHRLIPNFAAQSGGLSPDDIVDKLLQSIDPQERHVHGTTATVS